MKLYVGLGNPGEKYANHRHNAGFMLLDALADATSAPAWSSKFNGAITTISIEDEKILLLKPMTFMNRSGQSVAAAAKFYKIEPKDITVFHDELDLPNAKCRIKFGGGHGGHNGLRDIDAHCGKEYRRIRLGIAHPGHKDAVSGYVLHDFSKTEREAMDTFIDRIIIHRNYLINNQDAELMNKLAI